MYSCESSGCKYSQPRKGGGFPRAIAFILTSKDAGSSDATGSAPELRLNMGRASHCRGQLMLQLGLRVAAVGRLLVLSVSSLYQGWRHKAVGGRGKV